MITPVANYDDIVRKLRSKIIEQSQLASSRVLNANSIRGQDLAKVIQDTNNNEYESYQVSDTVLLFELLSHDGDDNVSFDNDTKVIQYTSYQLKIIIYGDDSNVLANKLKSRMLTSKVIQDLYDLGINLYKISDIETIEEFINNTLWDRCDFTIYLSVRYEYNQINVEEEFKNLNEVIIDKI